MAMQERLKEVQAALAPLCAETYHYTRHGNRIGESCIIWAEDAAENDLFADNCCAERQVHCTVDAYTRTEYDPLLDSVQDTLERMENAACSLSSVQYEEETGLIHYQWDFWIG